MRTSPIFAILSSFTPSNVPGVGTFYDFISRLWLGSSAHLSSKVRKPRHKPKKGKKKGDKSPLRRPGIVKRLVDRYLEHPPKFHSRPHDIFQKIFKECFVVPSTKHGILGDVNVFSIAGDGTFLVIHHVLSLPMVGLSTQEKKIISDSLHEFLEVANFSKLDFAVVPLSNAFSRELRKIIFLKENLKLAVQETGTFGLLLQQCVPMLMLGLSISK